MLSGEHILVAEDECVIALDLTDTLECAGAVVIGPAATVSEALRLAMAETLAARVGIDIPLPPFFEFPVGNMFWARPSALVPLLDLHLGWDDFPAEPVGEDGTIMHALERLLPFCAAKVGLTFATTHIPGITR